MLASKTACTNTSSEREYHMRNNAFASIVSPILHGLRNRLIPKISICLAMAIGFLAATQVIPAGATIISGQIDDFQGGTAQLWDSGSANPHPPTNISSGGPAGINDRYLQLTSDGAGAGGKLVTFNSGQWAGNYLGAGVSAISLDVNDVGSTDLVLRLILLDSAGHNLTTSNPINVTHGAGWHNVSFSLASGNLTGSGTYNTLMANVAQLDLVHSPSVISTRSSAPDIVAQLDVDNITAVPEPSSLMLTAVGFITVICIAVRSRLVQCRQA
jgi:hypothetical protein